MPTSCEAEGGSGSHGEADELEQAQQAREAFLAEHPDVPRHLAELSRAIEHEQEVQRGQTYRRVLQPEKARHLRPWRAPDAGLGIDMWCSTRSVAPSAPCRLRWRARSAQPRRRRREPLALPPGPARLRTGRR